MWSDRDLTKRAYVVCTPPQAPAGVNVSEITTSYSTSTSTVQTLQRVLLVTSQTRSKIGLDRGKMLRK